jgi:hypothetical protein
MNCMCVQVFCMRGVEKVMRLAMLLLCVSLDLEDCASHCDLKCDDDCLMPRELFHP